MTLPHFFLREREREREGEGEAIASSWNFGLWEALTLVGLFIGSKPLLMTIGTLIKVKSHKPLLVTIGKLIKVKSHNHLFTVTIYSHIYKPFGHY